MLETTLVQGVEPLAPAGTSFLWIYRTWSSTDTENIFLRHLCDRGWMQSFLCPVTGSTWAFLHSLEEHSTSLRLASQPPLFNRPFAPAATTIGARPFLLLTVTFLSPLHPPLLVPDWPGTNTLLLSSLIASAHKHFNLSCKEQDMSSSEWVTAAIQDKNDADWNVIALVSGTCAED